MYAKSNSNRPAGERHAKPHRPKPGERGPASRPIKSQTDERHKAVFLISSLSAGTEDALEQFANDFGYPIEFLPADSPEVMMLLEKSFIDRNTCEHASYGVLPSDVLDVALLHDEWASFRNAAVFNFTIFSFKRTSGQWLPHGVLATSIQGER